MRSSAIHLVGITTCLEYRDSEEYVYIRRDYPRRARQVGVEPILITPDLDAVVVHDICSGLIISGGGKLPWSLSEEAWRGGDEQRLESNERITWERTLLDLFDRSGKPVLGVCYGMQLMNLHFGGTLYADLGDSPFDRSRHGGGISGLAHGVLFSPKSSLGRALGSEIRVSSRHRQGVDRIAETFSVAARSDDGLVEAIESPTMMGVEWHPESDGTASAVYGWLLGRVRGHRRLRRSRRS